MQKFVNKQKILAQVIRHEKKIKLMRDILAKVYWTVHVLARQDTQLANLALADQMDILEVNLKTAITAIQTLHDKKLTSTFWPMIIYKCNTE